MHNLGGGSALKSRGQGGGLKKKALENRLLSMQQAIDEGDFEVAHGIGDGICHDVIRAIAGGAKNPQKLAQIAARALSREYPRWYT